MMKKILVCLNILIVLLLTSCTFKSSDRGFISSPFGKNNFKQTKIYFTKLKDSEGLLLIPVVRNIQKNDSVVDASLKELFLGPTSEEMLKGIMTEIPIGTRLIMVEEAEDEVLVDISSQFLTGGGSATMQLRYLQLYKTLRNVAPGKKIYLMVDGKNVKTIGGEGLEVNQPLSKINDYTKKYEKTDNLQP